MWSTARGRREARARGRLRPRPRPARSRTRARRGRRARARSRRRGGRRHAPILCASVRHPSSGRLTTASQERHSRRCLLSECHEHGHRRSRRRSGRLVHGEATVLEAEHLPPLTASCGAPSRFAPASRSPATQAPTEPLPPRPDRSASSRATPSCASSRRAVAARSGRSVPSQSLARETGRDGSSVPAGP